MLTCVVKLKFTLRDGNSICNALTPSDPPRILPLPPHRVASFLKAAMIYRCLSKGEVRYLSQHLDTLKGQASIQNLFNSGVCVLKAIPFSSV